MGQWLTIHDGIHLGYANASLYIATQREEFIVRQSGHTLMLSDSLLEHILVSQSYPFSFMYPATLHIGAVGDPNRYISIFKSKWFKSLFWKVDVLHLDAEILQCTS